MPQHSYQEVLQHIVAFLQDKLEGSPPIGEEADLVKDLHVGSLLVFAIVEDLEETYEIVIPLQLLYKQKLQTVGELARQVVHLIEEK